MLVAQHNRVAAVVTGDRNVLDLHTGLLNYMAQTAECADVPRSIVSPQFIRAELDQLLYELEPLGGAPTEQLATAFNEAAANRLAKRVLQECARHKSSFANYFTNQRRGGNISLPPDDPLVQRTAGPGWHVRTALPAKRIVFEHRPAMRATGKGQMVTLRGVLSDLPRRPGPAGPRIAAGTGNGLGSGNNNNSFGNRDLRQTLFRGC